MINIRIADSKEMNGDYSMFVSFDFDNKIVSTIREFPSRYWNKKSKEWELPFNKFSTLVEKLSDYEFHITGKYISPENKKIDVPVGFEFKTKPFEHQIDGFKYGLQYDRWLLGDEQGLGKTKQVIDIAVAKRLQKGYKHCLIICGVNGLKYNWQEEIKTHSNEDSWILGQRLKNGKWKIGTNQDKIDDIKNLKNLEPYFIITNAETLRNTEAVTLISKACKSGEIGIVAIDEIHKCKNPTSQQGKGILKVQPECRIAMTGTPLMNYPMDLYIILKWLGYEKHAFGAFKKHYCNYGGYGGYEVIGYKNLDELQEQLSEIMLRRLKDDVLDLPDKIFVNDYVEMTSNQASIYNEVTEIIKSNIDKIKMASNPLAELIRMRQATGYTGILSSSIKESAKLDRLEELVDENVSNGKKVIIFSNWTQMTTPIYDRLSKKYKGLSITGETKDNDRQSYVNAFQNDDRYNFIVGTIGAMGTGLTLNAASTVIFVDEPWTMAAKAQAIDRAHRIGTNHNITVITLMAKNTIDERIHELVEKKGAMSDILIDGNMNTNRADILDFLLS